MTEEEKPGAFSSMIWKTRSANASLNRESDQLPTLGSKSYGAYYIRIGKVYREDLEGGRT